MRIILGVFIGMAAAFILMVFFVLVHAAEPKTTEQLIADRGRINQAIEQVQKLFKEEQDKFEKTPEAIKYNEEQKAAREAFLKLPAVVKYQETVKLLQDRLKQAKAQLEQVDKQIVEQVTKNK